MNKLDMSTPTGRKNYNLYCVHGCEYINRVNFSSVYWLFVFICYTLFSYTCIYAISKERLVAGKGKEIDEKANNSCIYLLLYPSQQHKTSMHISVSIFCF